MDDNRQFYEDNGYVVLRDFWPHGELDALQAQLDELGRLVVGENFSSVDRSRYEMTAEQQSLLYDRLKYLPALSCMSGSPAIRKRLGMEQAQDWEVFGEIRDRKNRA